MCLTHQWDDQLSTLKAETKSKVTTSKELYLACNEFMVIICGILKNFTIVELLYCLRSKRILDEFVYNKRVYETMAARQELKEK